MDRLPPLTTVRAFEAVGRRLSSTIAAHELHVTPGAVTRQIRLLEDVLGVQLLVRGHRQVALTRDGEGNHRSVTKVTDMLCDATVASRGARSKLSSRSALTNVQEWGMSDGSMTQRASLLSVNEARESLDRSAGRPIFIDDSFGIRIPECHSAKDEFVRREA